MRRISDAVNSWLGHVFPERRLIVRSETRASYFRLSPLSQLFACVAFGAGALWTGYASWGHFAGQMRAAEAERTLESQRAAYEERLTLATRGRAALADRLSAAQADRDAALEALAARSEDLANARLLGGKLAARLAKHQERLAELSARHEETLARWREANERMAGLEAELSKVAGAREAVETELAGLTRALDALAEERDARAAAVASLSNELEGLKTEFARRREAQERLLSRVEDAARLGLEALEGVFARSGVNMDSILAQVNKEYSGAGGPFIPLDAEGFAVTDEEQERVSTLMKDLGRVAALNVAVERMPFARPVKAAARFTSGFGPRKDPKTGKRAWHDGIDLAAPRGTPIYATGDGVVIYSGRQRGYGNVVKIRHAFGYETVYAHLSKRRVKVGQRVERGDRIGDMGSTGRSTGNHVHYEIRVNGRAVNPAKYIEAARHVL